MDLEKTRNEIKVIIDSLDSTPCGRFFIKEFLKEVDKRNPPT